MTNRRAELSSVDPCAAARQRISLGLDDELEPLGRARLWLHLLVCGGCRVYSQRLRTATNLLRYGAPELVPAASPAARRPRLPVTSARIAIGASAAAAIIAATTLLPERGSSYRPGSGALPPTQALPTYVTPSPNQANEFLR